MNYLFVRHLMLKEIRHQRIRLLLIWLMAYLLPLTNFFQDEHLNDLAATFKTGLVILFCLLIILTWVSSILLDPTFGSDRFLTTRPIEWHVLLTSKVLFVLLFLWVPIVIFRLALVWTADVQLSYGDQALYVFETTLLFLASASLFVLPALFFRKLTTIILFIVGCVFFGYIFCILCSAVWSTFDFDSVFISPTPTGTPDFDPQVTVSLRISGFLAGCAILGATIIPVAILRFWKPSLPVPLTVVFAGLVLCLTYTLYWPYAPFDHFASDQAPLLGELASPLRNEIHFTLQNPSWDVSRNWNENSDYSKKNLEFRLTQKLHFDGIARPLLIWRKVSSVAVSLPSGKKLSSQSGNSRGAYSWYNWVDDYFRKECAGIVPSNPNYENSDMNQSFTFMGHTGTGHRPDISDIELPGATIRGSATFGVARLNIQKITPFKVGARLNVLRQVYEIRQITRTGGTIKFLLNRSVVPLLLRGDLERLALGNNEYSPFVIINRRTGEILNDKNDSDYYNPFDGLALQWWTLSEKSLPGAPKDQPPPPIPDDWLNDADICFFDIELLGSISFPYNATVTNVIH